MIFFKQRGQIVTSEKANKQKVKGLENESSGKKSGGCPEEQR